MSRHNVPARAPDLIVVVGWDGPLQSYFAQVHRQIPGTGQCKMVLWIGTRQREVADAAQLATLLVPFAELTNCLLRRLCADEAAGVPPTPLQMMMMRLTDDPPVSRPPPRRRQQARPDPPASGELAMLTPAMERQSCLRSAERWRRQAGHIRKDAQRRHLQPGQREALLREAEACDRQADWWLAGAGDYALDGAGTGPEGESPTREQLASPKGAGTPARLSQRCSP